MVLGTFDKRLAVKATKKLQHLGVEVALGAVVIGVDERGIDVRDSDGSTRLVESRTEAWVRRVGCATDGAISLIFLVNHGLPGHKTTGPGTSTSDLQSLDEHLPRRFGA